MMSQQVVIKEKCVGCQRFILIHNKIMSCQNCKRIVHAKCAQSLFDYDHIKDCWQCWECISLEQIKGTILSVRLFTTSTIQTVLVK